MIKDVMKIVHIIRDIATETGGPVSAAVGMAQAQAAHGHDVTMIATDYGAKLMVTGDAMTLRLATCKLNAWRWAPDLHRILISALARADVCHLHTFWEYPIWAGARACRNLNIPFILSPHGMLDRWPLSQSSLKKKIYLKLLGIPVLNHAAGIHLTSERELDESELFGNKHKGKVIALGVPKSAYEDLPDSGAFAQKYAILNGKKYILFLGRLHFKKQPDLAIRAFAAAHKIHPEAVLVMAGPGEPEYVAELKSLACELGVTDFTLFTGMLVGRTIQEAYRGAKAFILPSLQENFGVAVAEAMAAGCPVILSDKVDLAPEVCGAEAGIVCPADVASMSNAIGRLLTEDRLFQELGNNAQNLIRERYTWDNQAQLLEQFYQNCGGLRK